MLPTFRRYIFVFVTVDKHECVKDSSAEGTCLRLKRLRIEPGGLTLMIHGCSSKLLIPVILGIGY